MEVLPADRLRGTEVSHARIQHFQAFPVQQGCFTLQLFKGLHLRYRLWHSGGVLQWILILLAIIGIELCVNAVNLKSAKVYFASAGQWFWLGSSVGRAED